MILELGIHNFAIISHLHVSFEEGMTALTGETGAGKSIIIDAVSLLLGGRGSTDFLRKGAKKCVLEGLFTLPKNPLFFKQLEDFGIEIEEDSFILQREIHHSGKNICRLNGHLLSISQLKKIGNFLVDIQGQHDHQELLQAESHLKLLDEFAEEAILPSKEKYQAAYESYEKLASKVKKIQKNEKAFAQRLDMLKYQTEEISQAQLQEKEETTLEEEKNKLSNYQKIMTALSNSYQELTGKVDVLDLVGNSMESIRNIATIDPAYEEITNTLEGAFYSIQESIASLNHQLESLEWDEKRLDEVENRLQEIYQLKRKYGESIPAILNYYEEISKELAEASLMEDSEKLHEELMEKKAEVLKLGKVLQEKRQKAAEKLSHALQEELVSLYMPHTQFEVKFVSLQEDFNKEGLFKGEFYIQTNLGEDLKPLVKVASGGELSRLLLGLKSLFAKSLGVTSIVFDEVDTGVSGRVASAIAAKIHQIAKESQVLCITHLPQVAAVADQQYLIEKEVTKGRTETKVMPLSEENRVEVIAKMLAGSEVTPLSLEHAKELLTGRKKTS